MNKCEINEIKVRCRWQILRIVYGRRWRKKIGRERKGEIDRDQDRMKMREESAQ